jgi:glycosyltransferase involved in cell wall biosynthesis
MRASHGEIPVLLRGDSTLLDERPSPRLLLRRAVLRYVYRHVDIGLYVGQNNREYFLRNGLKDSQLRWAPHSIDNDRFADVGGGADRRACVWRRQLGIDDQHTTVLFAGKLEPTKAPDLLLRVFLRLAGDNEHLIIVGTGALEGTLRAIAAGHARVHFLGFQNQSVMPDVYRLGDVFVLPSQGETWGLAINEAMAAGRPVIVSDKVGCAPDLVRPENGVVFQSGNEEALGTGLMRVLRNEVARFDMGMASKKRIAAWSFEAQASAIEEATAYAISAL